MQIYKQDATTVMAACLLLPTTQMSLLGGGTLNTCTHMTEFPFDVTSCGWQSFAWGYWLVNNLSQCIKLQIIDTCTLTQCLSQYQRDGREIGHLPVILSSTQNQYYRPKMQFDTRT